MNRAPNDPFVVGTLDRSLQFLPEALTPLAHTRTYRELPASARLRYNQLFASCYHEHFIFLERMLTEQVLPALIVRYRDHPMGPKLEAFRAEERVHTSWFHRLHRVAEPQLYGDNYYSFLRVRQLPKRILGVCATRPWAFPFCLWLTMMIEERTILNARDILRSAESLEPHFVLLHRLHAADEARHVGCDAEVLKELWPQLSRAGKALNRWLFVGLLKEFFRLPKRAGWNVVTYLATLHPEIAPLMPQLRREFLALGRDPSYLTSLYSPSREPRTFALASGFEELRELESLILGTPSPSRRC